MARIVAVTVRLPIPLREFAAGRAQVDVAGATVTTALEDLLDRHPALRSRVHGEDQRLHAHLALFLDEQPLRHTRDLDRRLAPGAVIDLLPVFAGG